MNISSVVVKVLPKNLESVVERLKNSDFCDYYFSDPKGIVIVTLEGEGVSEEIQKLKLIEKVEGVLSAEMVYSYAEEELEENMKLIKNGVPEVLNKNIENAKDIVYGGDVRNLEKGLV